MVQVAGVRHSPLWHRLCSQAGTPRCTTPWWTFPRNTWKGRSGAPHGDGRCTWQGQGWMWHGEAGLDGASQLCWGQITV